MREVTYRYQDPLDVVWLEAAARIGLRVERSDDCYASTDGRGKLFIGRGAHLDADDCLSQMIFHELCHSLVQGPESFERRDWDLDNETDRDLGREHACLRLQAALAAPHGLRRVFAPTTDHRVFYDALPADPLSPRHDPTVVLARRGAARVSRHPWGPHLAAALTATARIARVVAEASPGSADLLWGQLDEPVAPHPSGLEGALAVAGAPGDVGVCGDCAWQRLRGPGKAVPRCAQQEGARVDRSWRGCARWEPEPLCTDCGACCREAYGAVEVSARDPFVPLHPALLRKRARGYELRREGDRCAALEVEDPGQGSRTGPRYRCVVYEDRPKTCRDFTLGSDHCLTARRRVGLSR